MIRPDLRDLINRHKPIERSNHNNNNNNNNDDDNKNAKGANICAKETINLFGLSKNVPEF